MGFVTFFEDLSQVEKRSEIKPLLINLWTWALLLRDPYDSPKSCCISTSHDDHHNDCRRGGRGPRLWSLEETRSF